MSFQLCGLFYLYASGKPTDQLNFDDNEEGVLEFTGEKLKFPCGLVIPANHIRAIKYRFMDNHHLIEISSQSGNHFYFNVPNESKAQHQLYVDNLKSAIGLKSANGLSSAPTNTRAHQLAPAASEQSTINNVKAAVGVGKAVFNILEALSDD